MPVRNFDKFEVIACIKLFLVTKVITEICMQFFIIKFSKAYFSNLIDDVYQNAYDYLVFDNNPINYDNTRIRKGIFPDKECIRYN